MTANGLAHHQLQRLLDVGRTLVSELDLEVVLRQVLEVARELTGARYAALGILDEDKQELERFVFVGVDEETRREIGPLPRGRGILGELIRDPRPLRLERVGDHPRSYGFPSGHPEMTSFLGVPIVIRGEAYGNLYLTEKSGGPFDEADEESVVVLADWASIAIGNARLYERVESRREELERAVRGLEATTAIARTVGGETDLERVLELLAKRGRALVQARSFAILLPAGEELRLVAIAGELPSELIGTELASAGTAVGEVLRSLEPERLHDLSSRVRHGLDPIRGEARSALLAPLVFRGRATGVLIAFEPSHDGAGFNEDDEYLLTSFAAAAVTGIATAQSVEADRLRHSIEASEHERGRWARELHDETLQDLGALKMILQSGLNGPDADRLRQAAEQAVDQADLSIAALQGLITELRPAALDELGLAPALEALVERIRTISGLDLELKLDLARRRGRLAPEVEDTAYRLVQEALSNVVKHAGAERVQVEVAEVDGALDVSVRDDGGGFDPRRTDGGYGLIGMRERVALLDGTLAVDSRPDAGCTIRARLPARKSRFVGLSA